MVVFKQISDLKKGGGKYTKKDHIFYVNYIATRDGAVYGEGMEHGLFGRYGNTNADDNYADISSLRDAEIYVGEMFAQGKDIYRCVISLPEEEAAQLGYLERDNWVKLLSNKMFDIADEYNIKYSNVEYVGSFHLEKGHPHLQFNFWDKNQTIRNKIVPKPQFERRTENIRAILSKELYKESIHEILSSKENAEKSILTGFNSFMRGISQQEISAAGLELKGILPELCDEKMLDIKVADSYISKIYEGITNVKQAISASYPKGALKYKYLPKQCKQALDDLTGVVLEHPDFRRELNRYVRGVKEYSVAHGNSLKTIASEQQKAIKELYKSFGNRILGNFRQAIREEKAELLPQSYAQAEDNSAGGVDIIVDEAVRVANIFDNHILLLCNAKGVFHFEDIEDNTRLQGRITRLEKMGYISHEGMRYEVLPELKSQVKELVEDFKANKLWGIDRYFTELKSFTQEDLKAHPKNENSKMEKRLPLLLAVGLVTEDNGTFYVTAEYKKLYKVQLDKFKQSQFDKWFYENIDNDVKISVFDVELVRMAHDGVIIGEDIEKHERGTKMEFRLRRLVAENYVMKDGAGFRLTEKFTNEVSAKLEEFKKNLYAADKALVKMEHFTLADIKENAANKKKNKEDEMGSMEKRLPSLLAAGLVTQTADEYIITDEYRTACYTVSSEYRRKNFEKHSKTSKKDSSANKPDTEQAELTKINLFDSEFLKLAIDGKFTQAEVENHSEGGRLDWRMRTLIKDEYVIANGINYTLTNKFMRKLSFTQRQFEKGFKVNYKDCAFLRLASDGVISKAKLYEQPNAAYLKWRVYGLQYKGLVSYDGANYSLTPKLCEMVGAAREKYYEGFTARLFDKAFADFGETFSLDDLSNHPMGDILTERMEVLLHKGCIQSVEDKLYSITQEFTAALKECEESFEIKARDNSLLKIANDKGKILQCDIEKNFSHEDIFMRLEELMIKGYANKVYNGYILSEEVIGQIKMAVKEQAENFAPHYFDKSFILMGEGFTDDAVEQHSEGIFLASRLSTLVSRECVTKNGGVYKVDTEFAARVDRLSGKAEAYPFDMNVLRLADENKVLTESTLYEQEKPTNIEYRLQDLICKGYVAHANDEYSFKEGFVKDVTSAYNEMKEHFVVQPFDRHFQSLGNNGVFKEKDLSEADEFFQKRLSSLLLLEYIKKDGDSYIVSAELQKEVAQAVESFTINHFDIEFVNCADKHGNLAISDIVRNVNADYLEKRMYSLVELGYITKQGSKLHLSPVLINEANRAANSYLSSFRVNCYDAEFLKIGRNGGFTKEELKTHEDFAYLNSRLRSLVQMGLVHFDGEQFIPSQQLQLATEAALKNIKIKSTDNAFLQINGTNTFTKKEVEEHFELGARLRELHYAGWVIKGADSYTVSEKMVKQIEVELKIFAETKIGIWDKLFVELHREMQSGFTKEDIKRRFPDKQEALCSRLEYLYVNNLLNKVGDRFFAKQELLDGVEKAEKIERGIRRQTSVLLLMDIFKMFSKLTRQQENRRENERQAYKELSLEAKKDIIADRISSSGMQWEENEI
ncbi:MAG: hypothetical protein RR622_08025 [Hydrogenoanaerobacterium sp.]